MDFRALSKRVPADLHPLRIWLGDPSTQKERRDLEAIRSSLRSVARRGDWDVLRRVKDRDLTPDEVHAAIRRAGLDSYRAELAPSRAVVTLGEAVRQWEGHLDGPTGEKYRQTVGWLVDSLGPETPMTPEHVTRGHIRDALKELRRLGLSENTRNGYATAWSSFFSWWMEREEERHEEGGPAPVMTQHPVQRLKSYEKPRARATRDRFLSWEEWIRLRDASPADVVAMYGTLLFCGLRPSEVRWLRPQDVRIPDAVDIRARDDWAPKGFRRWGVGEGSVPIHRVHLLPLLEEHRDRFAGEDFFFLNTRTGQQWQKRALATQLQRDAGKAGIPYGTAVKNGITPHVFRRSLGSWLAQADVQLLKIAKLLRADHGTVAKHYARLLPQDVDETLHRVI